MQCNSYISLNKTATTTEQSIQNININNVTLIANSGDNTLLINLIHSIPDDLENDETTIVLELGEKMVNFPVECENLYFKSIGGNTKFRFVGLRS